MTRDTDATRDWLGLQADADDTEVDRTRAELDAFLAQAPAGLSGWARGQRAGTHIHASRPAPTSTGAAATGAPRRRRSPLIPLGIAAAVAAGIVGVYNMGDTTDPAATAANPSASGTAGSMDQAAAAAHGAAGVPMDTQTQPPLDDALVKKLTAKIEKNPKDTQAMKELANEYSRAGHYRKASETQARIVKLEPKNTDARLALGVAHFNMDDLPTAEKEWNTVLQQDPNNARAYYDLGFLYFAKNPPQMDKAEAAWRKLQQIAPGSELAKSVEGHLDKFKSGAAGSTSPTDVPTTDTKTNG